MTLAVYKDWAVDSSGNTVASAQIEVRLRYDDSAATIYSDEAGTTPLTNPFNAGADGTFEFWAATGEYELLVGVLPSQSTKNVDLSAGGRTIQVFTPTQFGWKSTQTVDEQRAAVQAAIDATSGLDGAEVYINEHIVTTALYRGTDDIYPGYVADDENRRAHKAFIIYNRSNLNIRFGPKGKIDRSADLVPEVDGTTYSLYATTFYISRCSNVHVIDPVCLGYQDDEQIINDVKSETSGDSIQINNNCHGCSVIGGRLYDGTNGISVGLSRTSAEQNLDPAIPWCTNITIDGTRVYGCEHGMIFLKVDGLTLLNPTHEPWTRANDSVSLSQRNIYLHSCKNVYGTGLNLSGAFKVGVMVTSYASVQNVFLDVSNLEMLTPDEILALRPSQAIRHSYEGHGLSVQSDNLESVHIILRRTRTPTTVSMADVGHNGLTLGIGDCVAGYNGIRTNVDIPPSPTWLDNPIKDMKIYGVGLGCSRVDRSQSGYTGIEPNVGLLLVSGAVDGSADPIAGEVTLDNVAFKSENRNARLEAFDAVITDSCEFSQIEQVDFSARDYDLNYNYEGIVYVNSPKFGTHGHAQGPDDETVIADDTVVTIAPRRQFGLLLVQQREHNDRWGVMNYRCVSDGSLQLNAIDLGSDMAVTTGALTGTTGGEGLMTISVTEGLIYFQNRLGNDVNIHYQF